MDLGGYCIECSPTEIEAESGGCCRSTEMNSINCCGTSPLTSSGCIVTVGWSSADLVCLHASGEFDLVETLRRL